MKKEINCQQCEQSFKSYNKNPKYCSFNCRVESQKEKIDEKEMIRLYELGHTQDEVAELLGTSQKVIQKRMKHLHYKPRKAIKRNQFGENNSSWKGGRTKHSSGYFYRKCDGHPRATKNGGYVLEHILIVEEYIGRFLADNEVIHHINEIKDDNRLENLYLTNPSEHRAIHNRKNVQLVSNLNQFKIGD